MRFSTAAVMSMYSGVLLCDNMTPMIDFMCFMVDNEYLTTVALKPTAEFLRPRLEEQHPLVERLTIQKDEDSETFLGRCIAILGKDLWIDKVWNSG